MNALYFQHLAQYNHWANKRVYDVCGGLPEAAYLKERPCYFGSIHNTLNHILVGDLVWMDRFLKEKNAPPKLETLLYDAFEPLREARFAQDEKIIRFVESLSDNEVQATFDYHDRAAVPHSIPKMFALGHFFNHQTHHRGQIHCLLSSEMDEPPELDFIYFIYEKLEGKKR